jgi:hypothetical protein
MPDDEEVRGGKAQRLRAGMLTPGIAFTFPMGSCEALDAGSWT